MDPRIFFIILFIGFPLLELYILIEVGSAIGAITTIFVIVFTGVLGALLLQQQGVRNMSRMRDSMQRGEIPALTMFESMFVFAAAILLIIPGLITDAIGLILLIAPLRLWLVKKIMGLQRFRPPGGRGGPQPPGGDSGRTIINGDYTREDD